MPVCSANTFVELITCTDQLAAMGDVAGGIVNQNEQKAQESEQKIRRQRRKSRDLGGCNTRTPPLSRRLDPNHA